MRHAGAQRAREGECLGASGVKARVLRELARRSGRNWAETSACVRVTGARGRIAAAEGLVDAVGVDAWKGAQRLLLHLQGAKSKTG